MSAGVKRLAKITLLFLLKLVGVFAIARAWHRKHPRILCYHGAWLAEDGFPGDSMFIKARTFERRLDFLAKGAFNVIPLERAVDGLTGRASLPDDAVVITIDDGWYSTFAKMLPALKQRGMPATIYCDTGNLLAGGTVPHVAARYLHAIYPAPKGREQEVEDAYERATYSGLDRKAKRRGLAELLKLLRIDFARYEEKRAFDYMTPQQLREASDAGFDIELHTHSHSLHGFEPRLIEQEIETNRAVLSNLTGRPADSFCHFCYPSGVYAAAARPILQRLGILSATALDSRLATADDDPLFLPRILDGDHLTDLEFEAALYGIPDLLRGALRAIRRHAAAFTLLGAAKDIYRRTAVR
jgi:peptidoglycan/xylan/chitin deacetylase (PgdA/CDA1 family)